MAHHSFLQHLLHLARHRSHVWVLAREIVEVFMDGTDSLRELPIQGFLVGSFLLRGRTCQRFG